MVDIKVDMTTRRYSGSKKPQLQEKNKPQTRTSKLSPQTYSEARKTTRYTQIGATDYDLGRNRLLGINVSSHVSPEKSAKIYSAGRKNPRYSQNRARNYNLRQNLLLGINVSRYTETVYKNVLSGSKTVQLQQNRATDYDLGRNCLLGINVSSHTGTVRKNILS